jgi:hypothetical protein
LFTYSSVHVAEAEHVPPLGDLLGRAFRERIRVYPVPAQLIV